MARPESYIKTAGKHCADSGCAFYGLVRPSGHFYNNACTDDGLDGICRDCRVRRNNRGSLNRAVCTHPRGMVHHGWQKK